MGLSALSPDELRAFVEASCAAQGVPARVTDAAVLREVVVLLGGTAVTPRAHARSASTRGDAAASQPPDRAHPRRVQGAGSRGAGGDDGVVEDGADDRVLAVEVQRRPLSA